MHFRSLVTLGAEFHRLTLRFDVAEEIGVEPGAGFDVIPGENFIIAGRNVLKFVVSVLIGGDILEPVVAFAERRFGHRQHGRPSHGFVILVEDHAADLSTIGRQEISEELPASETVKPSRSTSSWPARMLLITKLESFSTPTRRCIVQAREGIAEFFVLDFEYFGIGVESARVLEFHIAVIEFR